MSDDREMEKGLAAVVRLHPEHDIEEDDAPLALAEREPWCAHRRTVILKELHRIDCKDCGREVDPFQVLASLAAVWERYINHRNECKRRADRAHDRLKELLRLEQNARARLKRIDPAAEKSAPKRPWGEGSTNL